jgi:ABC-2 type transport system ATP-binding protein
MRSGEHSEAIEGISAPAMVRIESFTHRYGQVTALHDLSLQVEKGIIHGLIGPDSAGKTTLIRAVCTLLNVSTGSVSVFGLDTRKQQTEIRSRIGYMPQRFSLYQDLSVEQNLRFFADLFGVSRKAFQERSSRLYQFSQLGPFRKRRASALSGGMKQKLALSCALIHDPELLILDEPTFGVDPVSRVEFWDILHELKAQGTTILVSTPYMNEAELCDRVTLLHKGKKLLEGEPGAILSGWQANIYSLLSKDPHALHAFLNNCPEVKSTQFFGSEIHITAEAEIPDSVFTEWQNRFPALQEWERVPPSMEDIFLELMQNDRDI